MIFKINFQLTWGNVAYIERKKVFRTCITVTNFGKEYDYRTAAIFSGLGENWIEERRRNGWEERMGGMMGKEGGKYLGYA